MSDHEDAKIVEQLRTRGYGEAADIIDKLHHQLDMVWVCPCCREGNDIELCKQGHKSGKAILARHELATASQYRQGLLAIIEEAREVFRSGCYQFSERRIREAFGDFADRMTAKYIKPQADHVYTETRLDRDDNPIPPTCAHCGRPKDDCPAAPESHG
jgi:hypothetical protein